MSSQKLWCVKAVAVIMAALLPRAAVADAVAVPTGTRVFIELDQQVTSKKKLNQPGTFVKAHVWKDVVYKGHTVVAAGAPVTVQVGDIKPAKVAGIKGYVELEALQVAAVNGSDVLLTGGYDQSGKSLMALSITLAAVVFVPLIFIKGKQAKLNPGTIFDATVAQEFAVEIDPAEPVKIKIDVDEPLAVEVLYDVLDAAGDKKIKNLPIRIRVQGGNIDRARVVKVNDGAIPPIDIELGEIRDAGEGFVAADASIDLKTIGAHFNLGINRFTVQVGDLSADVILDLEL